MTHKVDRLTKVFALVCMFLCLGVFTWAWVRQGENTPGEMVKYLIFSFSLALLFGILAFVNGKTRFNSLLIIVGCFAGLYVGEMLLLWQEYNLGDFRQQRIEAVEAKGGKFDKRDLMQVIDDHAKEGVKAYPIFAGSNFQSTNGVPFKGEQILTLASISHSLTITGNATGQWSEIVTDRYGFNNKEDAYNQPPELVTIGDSFTLGVCVKPEDTIAGNLEKLGHKVINYGYPGLGPLGELAILREYVAPLKPKKVIWVFYEGNDLRNLTEEMRSSTLMSYMDKSFSQNLRSRQKDVDQALEDFYQVMKAKKIEAKSNGPSLHDLLYTLRLPRLRLQMGIVKQSDLPVFEKIMTLAKEEVASWGGEILFVYLPVWDRLRFDKGPRYLERDKVLEVTTRLGLEFVDVEEAFRTDGNPLKVFPFAHLPDHYNELGYRIVADQINKSLESKKHLQALTR